MKILDVNVNNIVISKLVKTKTNFKYLIGYLNQDIRPLVLIMAKMSGNIKDWDKDQINKLMSFRIDDEKMEDSKNIKLNALPVYDDRYIKNKITYGGNVYTNFHSLNVPEDDTECESFTVFSIDSLLVYENKYCLEVCLNKCAYKIVSKQMTD